MASLCSCPTAKPFVFDYFWIGLSCENSSGPCPAITGPGLFFFFLIFPGGLVCTCASALAPNGIFLARLSLFLIFPFGPKMRKLKPTFISSAGACTEMCIILICINLKNIQVGFIQAVCIISVCINLKNIQVEFIQGVCIISVCIILEIIQNGFIQMVCKCIGVLSGNDIFFV